MTSEKLKRMFDACYQAKRIREMLPPLPQGIMPSYIQYMDVILSMEKAGVPAKISDISDRMNLPRPGVTRTVKEMEKKGLLKKLASKEDGRTFEELRMIYDGVHKKDRLRVCFDTCHVNDAGYDLVNDYEGVLGKFDEVLGLDQIAVFHINDSMNPLGAHKDRHANIGAGSIGFETLHKVVHDSRFVNIPKILETPWLCAEGETKKTIPPYKEEIAKLIKD